MGALKLTYQNEKPTLKVVKGLFSNEEKSCAGVYRYGFNGMESDNEVKGLKNSYTTEFRQYDPRLGRWITVDPLFRKFPWQSPYVAFDNKPIVLADPNGDCPTCKEDDGGSSEDDGGSSNESKDVNTIGAPVVTDPDIILSDKTRIITPKEASRAFINKLPTDPTFGFIQSGTGFEKVGFAAAGFGSEGGGGSFIAVKPTQQEVALIIDQIIPIQINPVNGLVSNNTLNTVTNVITSNIGAFVSSLPASGTPQKVEHAPTNVSVLINTGGNQAVELNNGNQILRAIIALNNPNIDNVNIIREDSGGVLFPDGSFGVFGTSPGQILLKISSKINVFGF